MKSCRTIATCARGHRSTVPGDVFSSGRAATHSCPICGLGVPRERTDYPTTGHGGVRTDVECKHDYEALDDKGWVCKLCGHQP